MNATKTYTARTQKRERRTHCVRRQTSRRANYMILLILLILLVMGHPRVELGTSRLSGTSLEKGSVYFQSENALASTSRFFRRANRTAGISPPRRTQNVHSQNSRDHFEGLIFEPFWAAKIVYAALSPLTLASHGAWT